MRTFWAAEWHSKNNLDGETRHMLWENCRPLLFDTREQARKYIKDKHGYITHRPDLQKEPHGWRVPQAVKVEVIIRKV